MEIENTLQSVYRPREITEEILSMLPVKSLLRFRCVSKSWCSLIDGKRFIKKHVQNSTRNSSLAHHRVLLFKYNSGEQRLWQRSVLDKSETHALELKIPTNSISLVGCCNGLVCLLLDRHQFILCNPSTRISKNLPYIDNMSRYGSSYSRYGFGWDESSGEYKVFASLKAPRPDMKDICRVYSFKSNSWKDVNACNPWKLWNMMMSLGNKMGILASGNLHWEMSGGGEGDNIVAFDLKREVFRVVEEPECLEGCSRRGLGVIGECLSLYYWCESSKRIDFWMMKESWERVVAINQLCSLDYVSPALAPFWIGGFLLIKMDNLMVFDGNGFRDLIQMDNSNHVYVESLISPREA